MQSAAVAAAAWIEGMQRWGGGEGRGRLGGIIAAADNTHHQSCQMYKHFTFCKTVFYVTGTAGKNSSIKGCNSKEKTFCEAIFVSFGDLSLAKLSTPLRFFALLPAPTDLPSP